MLHLGSMSAESLIGNLTSSETFSQKGSSPHRCTHGPQTYVPRSWLIVLVNLGYSFNVHVRLPLCVAMSQQCEEPGPYFQTMEGRLLIGYYVALFNVLHNIQVLTARSITASLHKIEGCG